MKENNKNQSSEPIQRPISEQIQRLTKEERETACVYNEADGYWTIYSAVQSHIRKFDKLNYPITDIDYYPDGEVAGKFYQVPKNAISFKDPTKKRNISEEQKQALRERVLAARAKRNGNSNSDT
jgi:hypothetical protein